MKRFPVFYGCPFGFSFPRRPLINIPMRVVAAALSGGGLSVSSLPALQACPTAATQVRQDALDLRPLAVSFQILDEDSVGKMYGKRISRDFFVISAAFSNRLGRLETGVSALAYSDSLYVRVRLEKRTGQSLSDKSRDPSGAWMVATHTDFGGSVIIDTQSLPPLAPEADPIDRADYPLPDSFQIQPFSFSEMIKEAFDHKKGRLTDVQIQNITLQTVRPIEELPFGRTVARTLFFPRRPFLRPGKDYAFRISEIYTGFFHTMAPAVHNRNLGPSEKQK